MKTSEYREVQSSHYMKLAMLYRSVTFLLIIFLRMNLLLRIDMSNPLYSRTMSTLIYRLNILQRFSLIILSMTNEKMNFEKKLLDRSNIWKDLLNFHFI